MDYLLPTSTDMPPVQSIELDLAPSPLNPLGVKGAGEGGIVCTGASLANAVSHALGVQVHDSPPKPRQAKGTGERADLRAHDIATPQGSSHNGLHRGHEAMDMKNITVSVDEKTYEALEKEAARKGLRIGELVCNSLRQLLIRRRSAKPHNESCVRRRSSNAS